MNSRIIWAAAAALLAAAPASAAVVFDNPVNFVDGNCVFNTTCGPQFGLDTFAAPLFTLAGGTTLTSGSFTVYTNSATQPSSVNWLLLSANGGGGLPGTLLASGNSVITTRTVVGAQFGYDLVKEAYALPSVSLGAGSYYIGLQAVSSLFEVYLASASAYNGAVQSNDGGSTWTAGYENITGVAVSLSGGDAAVPEPASWAMLIAGFGLTGAAMRRRRTLAAA